jgi:hypothetical protein
LFVWGQWVNAGHLIEVQTRRYLQPELYRVMEFDRAPVALRDDRIVNGWDGQLEHSRETTIAEQMEVYGWDAVDLQEGGHPPVDRYTEKRTA